LILQVLGAVIFISMPHSANLSSACDSHWLWCHCL